MPAMGLVNPLSLLEKQAKAENFRSALLWQRGQEASLSASLRGRISSKFKPHSEQPYSYIGIFFLYK